MRKCHIRSVNPTANTTCKDSIQFIYININRRLVYGILDPSCLRPPILGLGWGQQVVGEQLSLRNWGSWYPHHLASSAQKALIGPGIPVGRKSHKTVLVCIPLIPRPSMFRLALEGPPHHWNLEEQPAQESEKAERAGLSGTYIG